MRDGEIGTFAARELQTFDGQRVGERRQDKIDIHRRLQPLDALVLVIGPFAVAVGGNEYLLAFVFRVAALDFRLAEDPFIVQRDPVLDPEFGIGAADNALGADAVALELDVAFLRRFIEPVLPFCF